MSRKVILLLEADRVVAEAGRTVLRNAGFTAETVPSVALALKYVEMYPDCTLLVCPAKSPGTDAFHVLAQMQRHRPEVGVILTGAGDNVAAVRKAFLGGAIDVLAEPMFGANGPGSCLAMAVAHGLESVERRRQTSGYTVHLEQLVTKRATQLRSLRKDLDHWCDLTIATMGELLDLRDEETEGHSKRVTAYASELALAMGLRPAEVKTIVRGAYLHDIGKIATPDAILRKPGRLTREEMTIMQRHCEHGYDIVRKIPSLADAAEIVYAHQEAYDGRGYPRRLRAQEIPLGARIFAVADTLDAITSDRPYRRASSFEDAIEEIVRCSGLQFDPEVVETFLSLPKETWKMLREESEGLERDIEIEVDTVAA